MKRLDTEDHFEDAPKEVALVQSEAGSRWDLPDASFSRWWRALPEEDRAEFVGVYGGDERLARFVCALDYLTTMQARPQNGSTLVEAYAVAAGLPHDDPASRTGAAVAWKHDAVQALMDRLRYRSNRQAAARITNRTTAVIEEMLLAVTGPDVEIKEKATAVKAALSFMKMVSDEDIQERVDRTRRGFVKARQELEASKSEMEAITPDQAALHVKILRDAIGDDALKALVSSI